MPAKIKIVDVVDKEVKNDDDYTITNNEVEESKLPVENTTSEATEETTANVEEKDEGTPEQVSVDTSTTESKKIRQQELVKCEKCGKFVTAKTLKYTHSLKCGVEKYQPGRPKKSDIKINENIQEAPPPPPPPPPPEPTPAPIQKVKEVRKPPVQPQHTKPPVVKEVVKTFEEMRKERLKERLQQRAQRNINLFKQVL